MIRAVARIRWNQAVERQMSTQEIIERYVAKCLSLCYHITLLGFDDPARKVYRNLTEAGLRDGEGRRTREDR